MRIISQEQNRNINFDNYEIFVSESSVYAESFEDTDANYFIIGKYKTEKRAKEVFINISRAYRLEKKVYCMPKE